MCDYSLGGLPNRLAVEGEDLVVHRFPTHSIGLASPADLQPRTNGGATARNLGLWNRIKSFFTPAFDCAKPMAVCIPPGACLILKDIPVDLQCKWDIGEEEIVTFLQTSAEVNTYRDAIRFRTGRETPLQYLREGMRVKVASLGGDSVGEEEPAVSIPHRHPVLR